MFSLDRMFNFVFSYIFSSPCVSTSVSEFWFQPACFIFPQNFTALPKGIVSHCILLFLHIFNLMHFGICKG